MPVAPGTFGSLLAIPLFLAVPLFWTISPAAVLALALVVAAAVAIAHLADPLLGEHDSGRIVVDEIAGMLVALAGQPRGLRAVALAFVVFRVFDVLKPWPAGAIDRHWSGGRGVVLDDVASGVYANLVVRALLAFVPGLAA
ncbi:MAG: hypothetical protein RL698_2239 [Pseudomonadota bacterium]